MDAHSNNHITKKPEVCGGKACVAGTRIRVQDVYVWHELQGKSPDEIVSDFPQLTLAQVYAALAYYWDHPDEIQQEMKDAEDLLKRLKAHSPSPLQEKLTMRGTDAGSTQVPS
jgi:uncharacterized protein (DUF433 family)